jgi:hypothetical protein
LVLEFGFSTGFGYYRQNMSPQKNFAFQSADVLSFFIAAACMKHIECFKFPEMEKKIDKIVYIKGVKFG